MKFHTKNAAEKFKGTFVGTISVLLYFAMTSALPTESKETWNCEETAYYSVYEDISRTESKGTSNTKTLKWIDANTIGFESISLKRINPNSETFFRCLIPWFDGAICSLEWKEALWDKYVIAAPRPRTPSERQYSDRKLRSRN